MTWPTDPNGSLIPILEASMAALNEAETAPEPEPVPEPLMVGLTAHDRCDRCGAQAYFRVTHRMATPEITQPTIDFCGHHHRQHYPAMMVKGWVVTGAHPPL